MGGIFKMAKVSGHLHFSHFTDLTAETLNDVMKLQNYNTIICLAKDVFEHYFMASILVYFCFYL